jgi:hypothetical protein
MYIFLFNKEKMILKAGKLLSKANNVFMIEELGSGVVSNYSSSEYKGKEFTSRVKLINSIKKLNESIHS